MKINTIYNLAKKISARESGSQVAVSVRMANISVAISVIVMIISSSVVLGFRDTISTRIFDLVSQFQIESVESNGSDNNGFNISNDCLTAISAVDGVDIVSRYANKPILLRNDTNIKGVVVKGVESRFVDDILSKYMVEGELLNLGDSIRRKEIVISRAMSSSLNVGVGDNIELVYIDSYARRDRFKVAGIYYSAVSELDENIVFGDLRDVQRASGWGGDMVSGYDIYIDDVDLYDETSSSLREVLYLFNGGKFGGNLVETRDSYAYLFGWLDMHKVNELVIMVIMLIVSIFNGVSMALIILLQRTPEVGIMKAVGMRDFSVQTMFLFVISKKLVKGLIFGNAFAIFICFIQQYFNIIKLDASVYMVDFVPIKFDVWGCLLINVLLIISLLLAQFLVTYVVASVEPYKAIKYDSKVR